MKIILFLFLTACCLNTAQAVDIVFIVNDQTPVSSLSTVDIKDYYYKRKKTWPDGTAVRFIDRAPGSDVRNVFIS
ncbi:MAG: hypothetical protein ACXWC9_10090, partial [Pseudobdellovibrionaceae bacterium]